MFSSMEKYREENSGRLGRIAHLEMTERLDKLDKQIAAASRTG